MVPYRVRWSRFPLVAVAISVSAANAHGAGVSQWTFIGPPSRPSIVAVGSDPASPNSIFVATERDGVLRTDDGGTSWTQMNAGLPSSSLRALLSIRLQPPSPSGCPPPCYGPLVLLAGTSDAGVFRWDGSSWTAANNGLMDIHVTSFAVGPSGPVFVGTGGGVFRSVDFGATWTETNNGLTAPSVASLALLAGSSALTLYAATSNGVFKSPDGGATWLPSLGASFGPPSTMVFRTSVVAAGVGAVWVIGASDCTICGIPPFPPGLFKSVDDGQTWSRVQPNGDPLSIGFDETAPPTILVSVFNSLGISPQQSIDGGVTWVPATSGIEGHRVAAFGLVWGRPSTVLAGTDAGVYRSGYSPGSVSCVPDGATLCFGDGRFSVRVLWGALARRQSGTGIARMITTVTGAFWFFDPANLELAVKVLDARSINGKFWVFYGSLTNVEFKLTVTDTLTGAMRTYFNSQGQMAGVADTEAF